jgi:hypothetical protein
MERINILNSIGVNKTKIIVIILMPIIINKGFVKKWSIRELFKKNIDKNKSVKKFIKKILLVFSTLINFVY